MGVYLILPESMLTVEVKDDTVFIDDDDDELYEESPERDYYENPLLASTFIARDTSSVADSVDLLIERCPQLFHPFLTRSEAEEDDDDSFSDDDDDDHNADYFSITEYHLPLNDTTSMSETPRTAASKTFFGHRRRRFTSSSSMDDYSFGPQLDLEDDDDDCYSSSDVAPSDEELDDFDDDDEEDTIDDFPTTTFHFSEPSVPQTVVVVPRTTPPCN